QSILHGRRPKRNRQSEVGGEKRACARANTITGGFLAGSGSFREAYFLAPDLAAASAYFLVKRSTRPAVSTSFCLPVKKGWQLEQISTFSRSLLTVERV